MHLFRSILLGSQSRDEETNNDTVDSSTVVPSITVESDYCFTDDPIDQELLNGWKSCLMHPAGVCETNKFLEHFIQDYSAVIIHQSQQNCGTQSTSIINRPDVIDDACGDKRGGSCSIKSRTINDTIGHPSELVVWLADLLCGFVEPANADKSWSSVLNKKFSPVQFKTARLFCEESTVESSENDSSSSTSLSLAAERLNFIHIFHAFSMLLYWPRNAATVRVKVGRNVIQVYLDIVRCFKQKLDSLLESCSTANTPPTSMALESIEFVLNILNAGVHFLSYSSPCAAHVVKMTQFGLTVDFSWHCNEGTSSTFDCCQHFAPRHCHTDDNVTNGFAKNPHYTVPFPTNVDSFCGELTHIGADEFLISILMKVANVTCWLSSYMTNESSKLLSETLFSKLSAVLLSSLTLEVECLFSVLCLMTAQPLASMVDVWSNQCVSILRSFHMPTIATGIIRLDYITRDLILQRGLLCLSINNVFFNLSKPAVSQWQRKSDKKNFSIVDTISFQYDSMLFESVLLLCLWINNNDSRLCKTVKLVTDRQEPFMWFQNVSIKYYCPFSVGMPYVSGDLWPWKCEVEGLSIKAKQRNLYRLCNLFSSESDSSRKMVVGSGKWSITVTEIVDKNQMESFFNYKSTPIFRIANCDESFSVPEWLYSNSEGFSSGWSYLFDVLLNMFSDHTTAGELSEMFDTIITAVIHAVRSSLAHSFDEKSFPRLQFHFLIFLIKCFGSLNFVSIHRQHDLLDLLLGEYCMKGGRVEVGKFLSNCKFDCTVEDDGSGSYCSASPTSCDVESPADASTVSCVAYSWVFLHDSIFDFIRCIIGVSFNYVDDAGAGICSDIDLLCASIAGDQQPPDDYVVQVTSLLSFAFDSIGHGLQFVGLCSKCLMGCIDLSSFQLDWMCFDSTSLALQDVKYSMEQVTKNRPFLWPSRVAVLQLIVKIMDILKPTTWLSLFINAPTGRNSGVQQRQQTDVSMASLPAPPSPFAPSSNNNNKEVGLGRDETPKEGGTITRIIALLRDTKCREIGIFIMTNILTACSSEIVDLLQSSSSKEKTTATKRLIQVRQLACDALRAMLTFVNFAQELPEVCDSYTTSCMVLESLTGILRGSKFAFVRSCLQELFRKSDSITYLLCCLKTVTSDTPCPLVTGASTACEDDTCSCAVVRTRKLAILRHGLSLLTAAMIGNKSSKNEFRSILSAGHDRSSSISHKTAPSVDGAALFNHSSQASRYQKLKWMVMKVDRVFSLETFVIFIEMLLDKPCLNSRSFIDACNGNPCLVADGLFTSSHYQPRIKNYHVLPFLVGIIPQCSIPMQICMLNTLHNLTCGQAALVNLAACTQTSPLLLDLVLDLFPYITDEVQVYATNLLQTIGRYSISVSQLKAIFRLMHDKGEYRPSYTNHLLDGIRGMLSNAKGPRQFFVFDGHNSGLQLPPIMRWPSEKAFSFSIWFRISLQGNVANSSSYFSLQSSDNNEFSEDFKEFSPYLLCLRNSLGAGFEIFLRSSSTTPDEYSFVFQTVLENGDVSSYSPEVARVKATDDEWHFLAISVANGNQVVARKREGIISVLFDSTFVTGHVDFPFPAPSLLSSSTAQMIAEPLIGECAPPFRPKLVNTTMRGQIGAIYFFSEVLSAKNMQVIYHLGPDYCYCFEPSSGVATSKIFDGVLASSVALVFNSAACDDQLFLDITPEKNAVKWKSWPQSCEVESSIHPQAGCMHARRFGGTYRSSTQNIGMALDSLGGLKSIFPIFAHFDHPRQLSIVMDENADAGKIALDRSLDDRISLSVFQLLLCLLDESIESQRTLDQLSVMSLVGYCMQRVSPRHISCAVLNTMTNIYDKLGWHPAGQDSVLEFLLGNFRLFVFTDVTVQFALMDWLLELASNKPQKMHKLLGVQHILDAMSLHYWYKDPSVCDVESCVLAGDLTGESEALGSALVKELSESAFVAAEWTNPATTLSAGARLNGLNLTLIRQKLCNIAYALMVADESVPMPEDVETLLGYLFMVECVESQLECFRLVVHLLNSPIDSHVAEHVVLGFAFSQAIHPIMQLHGHPHPQIRMYSLLVICGVLNVANRMTVLPPIPHASRYYKILHGDTGMNTTTTTATSVHTCAPNSDESLKFGEVICRHHNSVSESGIKPTGISTLLHMLEMNPVDAVGLSSDDCSHSLKAVIVMLCDKSTASSDPSCDVTEQRSIIIEALQLLLFGENCGKLAADIEKLCHPSYSNTEFDPLNYTVLNEDVVFDEGDSNAPTICASVFPALIYVLRQDFFPVEKRLSVLVSLKSFLLSNFKYSDQLLRLESWQHEMVLLVVEESRLVDGADPELSTKKHLLVIDLCTRFLCDVHMQAVNFGCPGSCFLPSDTDFADPLYFIQATMRGERHLGACVLRNVLSDLSFSADSEINAKRIGLDLLQQTISILQQNVETVVHEHESSKQSHFDHSMDVAKRFCLHLNIWLVASITFEFLVVWKNNMFDFPFSTFLKLGVDDKLQSDIVEQAVKVIFLLINLLLTISDCAFSLHLILDDSLHVSHGTGLFTHSAKMNYLTFFQLEVDSIIKPLKFTGSKLFGKTAVANNPLSVAATGVLWKSIRVGTTVLLHAIAAHEESNQDPTPVVQFLPKLRDIVDILQQKEDDTQCESMYIIVRLCKFLLSTKLDAQADCVGEVLEMVLDLTASQVELISSLIISHHNEVNTKQVAVPAMSSPQTSRKKMVADFLSSKFRKPSAEKHLAVSSKDRRQSMKNMNGESIFAHDVSHTTLNGLRFILNLPAEVELTNKLWTAAMQPVWEEANARELSYLAAHSNAPCTSDESHVVLDVGAISRPLVPIFDSMYRVQCRCLTQTVHAYDTWRKRSFSKWSRIVADLSNERGPWGSRTTAADREVYWMLDPVESNRRLRIKLLRNTLGCRHEVASKLQQGYRHNAVTKQFERGDSKAPVDNSELVAVEPSAPSGLWKTLLKYQTNTTNASDSKAVEEVSDSEDEATTVVDNVPTDKELFSSYVKIVSCSTTSSGGSTHGKLEITKHRISFVRAFDVDTYSFRNKTYNEEFQWVCLSYPSTVWNAGEIRNIYQRYYQQRFTAIEIFFTNRTSVYINFFDVNIAKQCYYVIYNKMQPANISPSMGRMPATIVEKHVVPGSSRNMTQAWVNREVSNFDYLMHLNTIAGRSFNDMSQYPVFPWVIADYKSSHLNLRDPKTFRDLRYPMGSQNAAQRQEFVEKYDDLQSSFEYALTLAQDGHEDVDSLPPFHYGSHYSNMGFVLWYLLRLEPFTSLNIWLQDGMFDKADRLFDSIEACWENCTTSQADVKELIPEFFYFPEFLDNRNNLELGKKQNGETLGAVKLPPWARNSHDFVRINRDALESEYVSRHLHHWIDLIFGYKQRPPHMGGSQAAVDACNVFFHLTYTGAVDLEGLKSNDRPLYDRTVQQVDNFGQTPTELFRTKHPVRLPLHKVDIIWPIASCVLGVDTIQKGNPIPELPRNMVGFNTYQVSIHPVIFILDIRSTEKLITMDSSRVMGVHMWQVRQPDVVPPYVLKLDPQALRSSQRDSLFVSSLLPASVAVANRSRRVGVPYSTHVSLEAECSFDHSAMPLRVVQPDGTAVLRCNREIFEEREVERNKSRIRAAQAMSKKSTGSGDVKLENLKVDTRTSKSNSLFESPKIAQKETESLGVDRRLLSSASSSSQLDGATTGGSSRMKESGGSSVSASVTSAVLAQNAKPSRIIDTVCCQLFALLSESRLLFSCGHWDHSFSVTSADHSNKLIQSVRQHRDVVTCLAVVSDVGQHWLVTGSRDCTVMVWEVFPDRDQPVSAQPLHVLYGHDDVITTVSVNAELDVVLSGSEDGTVIAHNLRDGSYLRSIAVGRSLPSKSDCDVPSGSFQEKTVRRRVHWIAMSVDGTIIIYSNDGHLLFSYNVNGRLISIRAAGEALYCFCLSEDGKVIVTGGERGLVVLRWTRSLDFAKDGPRAGMDYIMDGEGTPKGTFDCPIRSVCLSNQERHLLVGLESGHICVMAQNSDYLRRRLHHKLLEIGILSQSE